VGQSVLAKLWGGISTFKVSMKSVSDKHRKGFEVRVEYVSCVGRNVPVYHSKKLLNKVNLCLLPIEVLVLKRIRKSEKVRGAFSES
jgi:hypothetical protein